ncbi:MAG: hypothetical protein WB760_11095 [Xanthobacteraceae bacterium]
MRVTLMLGWALVLLPASANSQDQVQTRSAPTPIIRRPAAAPQVRLKPAPPKLVRGLPAPRAAAAETPTAVLAAAASSPKSNSLIAAITLADIGFTNGLRFANLGGQHELYVPLPQDSDVVASNLMLVLDDFIAYEAKRNLEVQVNNRTVAAIVLDGKGRNRVIQVPLGGAKPKNGYLKLTFLYSGAVTPDHCIDVRYVGDSAIIKPETAVEVDVGLGGRLDVPTTAALMPREVAVVLPGRHLATTELATALTVGRALISGGRRVKFYDGFDAIPDLAKRDEAGHWAHGIVLVGPLADFTGIIDSPIATVAGDIHGFGSIDAVRVRGLPALVIADADSVRAARLFGTPMLAATRGVISASVGQVAPVDLSKDRVTFDQLGVPPEEAEVFGRAELSAIVDARRLPGGTYPTRLSLDVMVAPDGGGAKAVVSVFVNERLLGSEVAATTEATHLDLPLPDGLVGTTANIRVVVERDIARGDCRFGPQGYPAQILGSSALLLGGVGAAAHDFADLTSHFAHGIDVLLPAVSGDQPTRVLGIVAELASNLSPDTAPLNVSYIAAGTPPVPEAPFIAVGDVPPAGASPRVNFDRGRVVVVDPSGRTLLDLGGFAGGAVIQVLEANNAPGLWIKPLSANGQTPSPPELHLDHGDVAFVDDKGVALAMSTEHDGLVKISYPDQVSWLSVAERFRSWIIGALWLLLTAALLLTLQRLFRRRPAGPSE